MNYDIQGGAVADAVLLEDGTLQWHEDATEYTPETFLFLEKVEP